MKTVIEEYGGMVLATVALCVVVLILSSLFMESDTGLGLLIREWIQGGV